MMSDKEKLKFFQRDEFSSLFYRRALIKRKIALGGRETKETELRNRSALNKNKKSFNKK